MWCDASSESALPGPLGDGAQRLPAAERADGVTHLYRHAGELPAVGCMGACKQEFGFDGDPVRNQPAAWLQALHTLGEHAVA